MNFNKLWKMALKEASRLRLYSNIESINSLYVIGGFSDLDFYNNIKYYSKIPLYKLTNEKFVTSKKPINNSKINDIILIDEDRNHKSNIYTPLEYFLINDIGTDILIDVLLNNTNYN